jgi:hypothetical protein
VLTHESALAGVEWLGIQATWRNSEGGAHSLPPETHRTFAHPENMHMAQVEP